MSELVSWADVREEFMGVLTPEERARIDANVKTLGELLDARDAGRLSLGRFNAAVERLNRPAAARRPFVVRRPSVRARPPKVAF